MAGKFKVKFTPLLTKFMVCFLLFVPVVLAMGW
jgi:hypothetical protein